MDTEREYSHGFPLSFRFQNQFEEDTDIFASLTPASEKGRCIDPEGFQLFEPRPAHIKAIISWCHDKLKKNREKLS